MDSTQFAILIAVAAAAAVWAAAQFVLHLTQSQKRQLSKRLESGSISAASGSDPLAAKLLVQDTVAIAGLLGRFDILRRLNSRLSHAFPDARLSVFLSIMAALAGVVFAVSAAVMDSVAAGAVCGCAAGYLPLMLVNSKGAKRQRGLVKQLPEALDFLSRVLRAGHSLSNGLQMMGEELPAPLGVEFRRCYAQHSLGQPLEDAMRDMVKRIESTDFAFFVTAVLIQRQTGGDLSEVLRNISATVRQRIRMSQHVRAITAEGRLTSYVLVAFPIVLFVVSYALNPGYAGLLLRTDAGRIMLGSAAGLVTLGLIVIRRIVTVKI